MVLNAKVIMDEAAFLISPPWLRQDAEWIWDYVSTDVISEAFHRSVWRQVPLECADFPTREDKVQEACWNTGMHGSKPFIQRVYARWGSPDAPQYATYGPHSIEVCGQAEYEAKTPQEREGWVLVPPYSRLPSGAEWRIWEADRHVVSGYFQILAVCYAQQEDCVC